MVKNNLKIKGFKSQFMKDNKFNYSVTVALQIVVAVINISIAFFIMLIVGAMESKDTESFKMAMILMVVIGVTFVVFSNILKIFKSRYMKQALFQFKKYVFKKILNKSIGEFSGELSSKFISAFSNDLTLIEMNYLNGNVMIIYYAVMFIITILAMAYINVIIMLCVLVGSSIPIVVSFVFGRKLISKEKQTSEENETFVDQIKDLLNGFIIIKSFKAEKEVLNIFGNKNFSLEEIKGEKRETNDAMVIASQISALIVISIIFILGVYFIFNGTMSIASVLASVQLSNFITDPIKQLIPLISNRRAALSLIEKISDVMEEHEYDDDKEKITTFDKGLVLDGLSLAYEEKVVLKNINLSFEKGKSYAVVGGSGSGKSTLLRLLLGFFKDYEGNVYVDNHNLKDISLDSLYDVVSVIQQNVFLFNKSIKENITMFKEFSEGRLEKAINISGLSALISEKGFDYVCGDGGANLSGGEKQRISIARCLLRETPILLMDEATASLDNKIAFQIEKDILSISGLTRIIVTHKLEETLLDKYDEIVVLKEGKVWEKGSFKELMDLKGYFYSLYNVSSVS